ncbi:hypothetical protein ACYOEI_07110 [Singulisphaera rosea]
MTRTEFPRARPLRSGVLAGVVVSLFHFGCGENPSTAPNPAPLNKRAKFQDLNPEPAKRIKKGIKNRR